MSDDEKKPFPEDYFDQTSTAWDRVSDWPEDQQQLATDILNAWSMMDAEKRRWVLEHLLADKDGE